MPGPLTTFDIELDRSTLARARGTGRAFAERLELDRQLEPFRDQLWRGGAAGPALHLDDVSDIPFLVDIAGVEEYQHRARLRAGDGDLFAAVTPVTTGYEPYCRDRLGLGRVRFVAAEPVDGGLAVAKACAAEPTFGRLVAAARKTGGLLLHPYMGIDAAWDLARRLHLASGAPVSVLAPPPPVTWVANDKARTEDLVAAVVGRGWLIESRRSRDPEVMTSALLELADTSRRVALKRLRCASAMGNLVFEADGLREAGDSGVEAEVRRFLERTEWQGDEEVLVCAWEETDLSPSTQLWIPPVESGPPRLDGIYEQILEGETGVFVGSRPSRLPQPLHAELAAAALQVAAALQALGYVGRCSFDHLVVGEPEGDYELRFTECNGRWGGTSTPMSLVDRLFPAGRPSYRAQDFVHADLVGVPFVEVLRRVGDEAFDAATGKGRFLFYNVGPLLESGKLDVIALGSSQEEAETAMLEDLPRLLGLA